jgi:hypothetical protein
MKFTDEMMSDALYTLAGFDVFDLERDIELCDDYYKVDSSNRAQIQEFLRKHGVFQLNSIPSADARANLRKVILRRYDAFLRILRNEDFPFEAALRMFQVEWVSPYPRFFFEEGYRHFYWDMKRHEEWLGIALVPASELGVPVWEG